MTTKEMLSLKQTLIDLNAEWMHVRSEQGRKSSEEFDKAHKDIEDIIMKAWAEFQGHKE